MQAFFLINSTTRYFDRERVNLVPVDSKFDVEEHFNNAYL